MESPTCSNTKSLVSAIHDKYDDDTPVEDSFCQIYVSSSAPGHVEGQLRLPKSLGMEQFGITCAGNPEDLGKLSADVEELDLADNLLSSWDEVFLILDSLHKLTFLNLTRNPLSQLNSAPNARYSTLKKLALNFTNLTWETIQNLLTVLPNLEELYLSGNSYDTIDLNIPAYESLRLLQLNENKFEEWSCVLKIDKVFPKLRTLILAHNKISTCGSVEENESLLSHLKVLNMNNTQIAEWNELDKLSVFKSLSDIRLASIPIIKDLRL
ncbi:TBCEL [Bugula neritina]|uniref:TBCEL n=1 Tax=Bugula neritina TaxID=10212 RepID=A0A7J7J018_BUGNE|nr:TBCEL [Bugula neritina]